MDTPLKIERLKRGISTKDLASAMGVAAPSINRIENCKMRASLDLANRLAKYFGNQPTRDQILFPEDYVAPSTPPRKPIRTPLQKAS